MKLRIEFDGTTQDLGAYNISEKTLNSFYDNNELSLYDTDEDWESGELIRVDLFREVEVTLTVYNADNNEQLDSFDISELYIGIYFEDDKPDADIYHYNADFKDQEIYLFNIKIEKGATGIANLETNTDTYDRNKLMLLGSSWFDEVGGSNIVTGIYYEYDDLLDELNINCVSSIETELNTRVVDEFPTIFGFDSSSGFSKQYYFRGEWTTKS